MRGLARHATTASRELHTCCPFLVGDAAAFISVVQFSSNWSVEVGPTRKGSFGATTDVRALVQLQGGTNMAAGIEKCRSLLTQEAPMSSSANAKVIVLLTDGAPDSQTDAASAAAKAKSSNIAVVTVGVGGADLTFLEASISTGAGYSFSSASFNNDAANCRAAPAGRVARGGFPAALRTSS